MVGRAPVMTVSVTGARKVDNMLTGFKKSFPIAAKLSTKKIAKIYAQKYLEQMSRAGARFTGPNSMARPYIGKFTGRSFALLKRQIKNPIKTGKNEYGVLVSGNLIMLDQMRPHRVALLPGRSITAWARRKGFVRTGFKSNSIDVHPHPWIKNANRNAEKHIRMIAEKEVRRARRKRR